MPRYRFAIDTACSPSEPLSALAPARASTSSNVVPLADEAADAVVLARPGPVTCGIGETPCIRAWIWVIRAWTVASPSLIGSPPRVQRKDHEWSDGWFRRARPVLAARAGPVRPRPLPGAVRAASGRRA